MMSQGKGQPRARKPGASSPGGGGPGRAGPGEEARGEQPWGEESRGEPGGLGRAGALPIPIPRYLPGGSEQGSQGLPVFVIV